MDSRLRGNDGKGGGGVTRKGRPSRRYKPHFATLLYYREGSQDYPPSPSVIPAQAGIHLSYRPCDRTTALRAGKSRNLRVTPQFGGVGLGCSLPSFPPAREGHACPLSFEKRWFWDVAFLDSRFHGNDGGERSGMPRPAPVPAVEGRPGATGPGMDSRLRGNDGKGRRE